jgi:hypothetical protein
MAGLTLMRGCESVISGRCSTVGGSAAPASGGGLLPDTSWYV